MVVYMHLIDLLRKMKFSLSINWVKTVYFNYKMFPIKVACKFPVFIYGKAKLLSLKGEIIINAPIKRGMIGFGQQYEMSRTSKGTAEILINGKMVFNGYFQFGKDYFIYIEENAYCELGHMSSIGSNGKLICVNHIMLGDFARLGYESQIIDTNFHQMIDTKTGEKLPMSSPIKIGNYNYIGSRVSIMSKTVTPSYCTIASNSLCNKNFSELEVNSLIGGIPAVLVRKNIKRDWEGENLRLLNHLKVK